MTARQNIEQNTQQDSKHFFTGNFAPLDKEVTLSALSIKGTIPAQLSGALYRVGPNPQYPPRDDHYHWFAGDGMVHAFFIDNGEVAYANRWARTPKWALENQAGRALFGTYGNPATSDPSVIGRSTSTANTSMLWHGQRLFALGESHQPFELDPLSLESRGHQCFDGKVNTRFTAHPKLDPASGDLHFFAYSPNGPGTPELLYGVLDRHCEVSRLDTLGAPYASMVHDFGVTQKHVLFPVLPLTGSIERAMRGKPMFAWEADKRSYVGIMDRHAAPPSLRWFDSGACHVFHVMNAWDDGDSIVAYVMQSDVAPGLPNADGGAGDPSKMGARLCRWTFNLASDDSGFKREYLDDLVAEFPRIDERYSGRQNRFGFYCCHAQAHIRAEAESVLYDSLACFDFQSGAHQLYSKRLANAVLINADFIDDGMPSLESDVLFSQAWSAGGNSRAVARQRG